MSRTRILYWFRTPPGVMVGRSALDESAIRSIEDNNPDVEFDWSRILKDPVGPELVSPPPRAAERTPPRRPADPRVGRGPAPSGNGTPIARATPPPRPLPQGPTGPPAPPILPPMGPDQSHTTDGELPPSPVQARLGVEGLLRLRARYAEILARISERVDDVARQDELKAQAERLNPDTWVTDDDVRVGVEEYESVLSALRAVVGQARRRRRPGAPGAASGTGPEIAAGEGPGSEAPGASRQTIPSEAERRPQPGEEPV